MAPDGSSCPNQFSLRELLNHLHSMRPESAQVAVFSRTPAAPIAALTDVLKVVHARRHAGELRVIDLQLRNGAVVHVDAFAFDRAGYVQEGPETGTLVIVQAQTITHLWPGQRI